MEYPISNKECPISKWALTWAITWTLQKYQAGAALSREGPPAWLGKGMPLPVLVV